MGQIPQKAAKKEKRGKQSNGRWATSRLHDNRWPTKGTSDQWLVTVFSLAGLDSYLKEFSGTFGDF